MGFRHDRIGLYGFERYGGIMVGSEALTAKKARAQEQGFEAASDLARPIHESAAFWSD